MRKKKIPINKIMKNYFVYSCSTSEFEQLSTYKKEKQLLIEFDSYNQKKTCNNIVWDYVPKSFSNLFLGHMQLNNNCFSNNNINLA